ncbi:MAG: VOC family protein [Pyrinomonadaceae bacterium]
MIKGLRTVTYQADDLEKAKDWYSQVLGFAPYFDESFYVGFDVGGFELGLMPSDETIVRGNNAVAFWGVEDIKVAQTKLFKLGAEKISEIVNVGENLYVATVKDPFGNVFGIIENPHFKLSE